MSPTLTQRLDGVQAALDDCGIRLGAAHAALAAAEQARKDALYAGDMEPASDALREIARHRAEIAALELEYNEIHGFLVELNNDRHLVESRERLDAERESLDLATAALSERATAIEKTLADLADLIRDGLSIEAEVAAGSRKAWEIDRDIHGRLGEDINEFPQPPSPSRPVSRLLDKHPDLLATARHYGAA